MPLLRVIVTAVYKKTTIPELHFFNNCFDDDFSTREVVVILIDHIIAIHYDIQNWFGKLLATLLLHPCFFVSLRTM